jgi:hypothetical protein
MKHTLQTTPNHAPRGMPTQEARKVEEQTYTATLAALRRVGGIAHEWNRERGTRIDTRTLAARVELPSARVFGRREHAKAGARPPVGLVLLIDDSGSMDSGQILRRPRHQIAAAVAAGLARGCAQCGVPVGVAHHDATGSAVRLNTYENTRDVIANAGELGGGNRDAYAVAGLLSVALMPAERTIFALIADGLPNDAPADHARAAGAALATCRRVGAEFVYLYLGNRCEDIDRAREEWGAQRVHEAMQPAAITRALVRAIANARQ